MSRNGAGSSTAVPHDPDAAGLLDHEEAAAAVAGRRHEQRVVETSDEVSSSSRTPPGSNAAGVGCEAVGSGDGVDDADGVGEGAAGVLDGSGVVA